jgi:hypothetical protein
MNETALKVLAKSGPWAVVAGVLIGVFVFDVRVGLTETRDQHFGADGYGPSESTVRATRVVYQQCDQRDAAEQMSRLY